MIAETTGDVGLAVECFEMQHRMLKNYAAAAPVPGFEEIYIILKVGF